MSILANPKTQAFCDKHNLYEYGIYILVTMPDGYQFITNDSEIANDFLANGAKTEHVTEFGI
jgi:hypothetical protein